MARPKSDIEPRILHAARARFLFEGVDGASLRAIAKDASTSIGMVYYYFPTKDDLFLAVVEEVYERVLADLVVALAPEHSVRERIRRLYERIGRLSDEELLVLRLVVREALISSTRLERILSRFERGHLPLVFRTISDGMADGTLDAKRHPLLLAGALVGMGGAPQVLRRVLGDRFPALGGDGVAEQLVDLLLNGAASRST
jgi:AcrR family transcriptional regulator